MNGQLAETKRAKMKTFKVYKHPTLGYDTVKVGFSWPVFFHMDLDAVEKVMDTCRIMGRAIPFAWRHKRRNCQSEFRTRVANNRISSS